MQDVDRRAFFRQAALVATAGLTGLAGCIGDGGDNGGPDDPCVPVEPNYRGWFDGVSNYNCTVDARGRDEHTVLVGVQGNNGLYKFGPAAVAVSPGTSITWEWTGRGGTHNVVAEQGSFHSGRIIDDAGYTFQHTFERPGIYRYVCDPHRSLGMKGAIFVTLG